jgi:amino acid transporter
MSEEQIENATSVALTFGTLAIGPAMGAALAVIIGISCLGALNATLFSSARLIHSASTEGFIPLMFSELSQAGATPVNAILLHGLLTTCYVLVGDFQSLLTLFGVAAYTFYFMTVLGVVVLRFKDPELDRPYRTWIVTPILFCCVSLFLISRTLFERPLQSLFVALFILAGLPVYFYRTDSFSCTGFLQFLRLR